jgi:hypothetical protein
MSLEVKMKGIMRRVAVIAVLMMVVVGQVHADGLRVVRSCIFPGMGQLGDDQKVRGLVYLIGEVGLLSGAIGEIAKSNSYARSTEYFNLQYTYFDSTIEQHSQTRTDWVAAEKKSKDTKLYAMAFAGGAAVWWVWNIVDAMIFAPAAKDNAYLSDIRDNLVMTTN